MYHYLEYLNFEILQTLEILTNLERLMYMQQQNYLYTFTLRRATQTFHYITT